MPYVFGILFSKEDAVDFELRTRPDLDTITDVLDRCTEPEESVQDLAIQVVVPWNREEDATHHVTICGRTFGVFETVQGFFLPCPKQKGTESEEVERYDGCEVTAFVLLTSPLVSSGGFLTTIKL